MLILCSVRGINGVLGIQFKGCPFHTGFFIYKVMEHPSIGILSGHCIFDLSCQSLCLCKQGIPLHFHWLFPGFGQCQASHLLIVWLLDFHDDCPGIGIDLMGGIGRNRDHDSLFRVLFVTAFSGHFQWRNYFFPFIQGTLISLSYKPFRCFHFFDPVSRTFQFFRCYQIAFLIGLKNADGLFLRIEYRLLYIFLFFHVKDFIGSSCF